MPRNVIAIGTGVGQQGNKVLKPELFIKKQKGLVISLIISVFGEQRKKPIGAEDKIMFKLRRKVGE